MLRASAALGALAVGITRAGVDGGVGAEGGGGRETLVAVEVGGAPSPLAIVPSAEEDSNEFFVTLSMRLLGFGSGWPVFPMTAKNANRKIASASPIMAGMGGSVALGLSPRSICSFTCRMADGIAGGAFGPGPGVSARVSMAGDTKSGFADVGGANGTSSTTGPADAAPGRVPFSSACMSGVVERK
jgi:hypothetical protein